MLRLVSVALALLLIGAMSFVFNEARKEVVYLCGNFTAGVSQASVVRQLETGNFLRYRYQTSDSGQRIVADSVFNLGAYRCVVELDQQGIVIQAESI